MGFAPAGLSDAQAARAAAGIPPPPLCAPAVPVGFAVGLAVGFAVGFPVGRTAPCAFKQVE